MNYAVIENGIVVNLIVADSLEIAEQATGLLCVHYTDDNPASIGDKFEETPAKKVK